MVMGLKRDLLHAIDPARFARDELGFEPDDWQADVLRDTAQRVGMNITRQGGKSTISSIKALHTAIYRSRSLSLVLAPSQRQSIELFRKITDFREDMEHPPALIEDNKLSCQLENKSRIVALPGSDATIRGYSAPVLVIADEASRIPDMVFAAVRPMLATSGGSLMLLSTPFGKRGMFYRVMTEPRHWSVYTVPATRVSRIPPAFLEEEKADMLDWEFRQEYECEFVDLEAGLSVFNPDDWKAALSDNVTPYTFARLEVEAVT
jgi:hypothetical protein